MAAVDATGIVDAEPYQHIASEGFDECHPLARADWFDCSAYVTCRQVVQDLLDHGQALFNLLDAYPGTRVHVAFVQHRHVEVKLIVWRVTDRTSRIEVTAGGATDMAAGTEASRQFGGQDAGAHCAVL